MLPSFRRAHAPVLCYRIHSRRKNAAVIFDLITGENNRRLHPAVITVWFSSGCQKKLFECKPTTAIYVELACTDYDVITAEILVLDIITFHYALPYNI
jgi:cobalamin biosynthesis protein CobD/CbiB